KPAVQVQPQKSQEVETKPAIAQDQADEALPREPPRSTESFDQASNSRLNSAYGNETECIYTALVPKANGKFNADILQETSGASTRPISDCTEYIEIVSDGPLIDAENG
uniref:Polyprotein n=1 Tax=Macrostomum lignano TaxID=282301 RepID=A0A1I8J6J1_9PLAT